MGGWDVSRVESCCYFSAVGAAGAAGSVGLVGT